MPKSERKSESPGSKPLSRHERVGRRGDESLQRVLMLLFLVVSLTFIIVPKGVFTPTEFSPGDISPRDIKAPRDLLIPDEDLTAQKRLEAEKGVVNLYDYDPAASALVADQAVQVLAFLRSDFEQATAETGAEQQGECQTLDCGTGAHRSPMFPHLFFGDEVGRL